MRFLPVIIGVGVALRLYFSLSVKEMEYGQVYQVEEIVRVLDGDTFHGIVCLTPRDIRKIGDKNKDCGMYKFRLDRYDAPELSDEKGDECRDRLIRYVSDSIKVIPIRTGIYDRIAVEVLHWSGTNINDSMVGIGCGEYKDYSNMGK